MTTPAKLKHVYDFVHFNNLAPICFFPYMSQWLLNCFSFFVWSPVLAASKHQCLASTGMRDSILFISLSNSMDPWG